MTVAELQAILARCPPHADVTLDCDGAMYVPLAACLWTQPKHLSVVLLTDHDSRLTASNREYDRLYRREIPQGDT